MITRKNHVFVALVVVVVFVVVVVAIASEIVGCCAVLKLPKNENLK